MKNWKKGLTITIASLSMIAIKPNVAEANFTATCREISLDNHTFLKAQCQNEQGDWVEASIFLNDLIGRNQDGRLVWQRGGNFLDTVDRIVYSLTQYAIIIRY